MIKARVFFNFCVIKLVFVLCYNFLATDFFCVKKLSFCDTFYHPFNSENLALQKGVRSKKKAQNQRKTQFFSSKRLAFGVLNGTVRKGTLETSDKYGLPTLFKLGLVVPINFIFNPFYHYFKKFLLSQI